jgi:pyruvate/2-oxoglutarate dehydrogenase complex dihydrolipoamide dehydrogenase (E3) component
LPQVQQLWNPFLPYDTETVVSSDEAIAFDSVPEKLVVIGAGAIGLELGSVWSRYGSDVTVVEFSPKIAAGYDDDVSSQLERSLTKQGLNFHTKSKVTDIRKADGVPTVIAEMLAGIAGHVNYDVIPNVIYTEPEVASVGLTEAVAKEQMI